MEPRDLGEPARGRPVGPDNGRRDETDEPRSVRNTRSVRAIGRSVLRMLMGDRPPNNLSARKTLVIIAVLAAGVLAGLAAAVLALESLSILLH